MNQSQQEQATDEYSAPQSRNQSVSIILLVIFLVYLIWVCFEFTVRTDYRTLYATTLILLNIGGGITVTLLGLVRPTGDTGYTRELETKNTTNSSRHVDGAPEARSSQERAKAHPAKSPDNLNSKYHGTMRAQTKRAQHNQARQRTIQPIAQRAQHRHFTRTTKHTAPTGRGKNLRSRHHTTPAPHAISKSGAGLQS